MLLMKDRMRRPNQATFFISAIVTGISLFPLYHAARVTIM